MVLRRVLGPQSFRFSRSSISIDLFINLKYGAGPPPVMFSLSSPVVRDHTDSPLRLEKLQNKLSETANSVRQFMTTVIIKSSETLKITFLNPTQPNPTWLKEILRFAVLK